MNRYPRFGIVSMYRGLSAESPRSTRSLRMAGVQSLIEADIGVGGPELRLHLLAVTTCPGRSSNKR